MSKINNTQRAGMVRMLVELQRKLEAGRSTWFSYSHYSGFSAHEESADPDGKLEAMALRMEAELKIREMKEEKDTLETKISKGVDKIQNALKAENERMNEQQKAKAKSMKLAIRDLWAAETIDDAKAIVAKFIQ